MRKLSSLFIISVFFTSISSVVVAEDMKAMKEEAVATTKAFVKQLGGAMKKEMKAGGPVAAVKVCSELAPQITAQISREKGWKVTRVGTRVRNPMLGLPDPWEQKVLAKFQDRAAKGEKFDKMAFAEIVEEPNGKYFRFMKAIGVKGQCLACHGDPAGMKDEVKALLKERYPHDQAKGYKAGDLRGAVSIKRPL
ncbi:Tll0287-like domain-containing protein [Kaarinaea lacus]